MLLIAPMEKRNFRNGNQLSSLKTKRIMSLLLLLFRCFFSCHLFVCFKFNYQLPHSEWPKRKWHNKFGFNCFRTKPSKFPLIALELYASHINRINGPFPRIRCDWYVWNFRVKFLLCLCVCVKWWSHSQWYLKHQPSNDNQFVMHHFQMESNELKLSNKRKRERMVNESSSLLLLLKNIYLSKCLLLHMCYCSSVNRLMTIASDLH